MEWIEFLVLFIAIGGTLMLAGVWIGAAMGITGLIGITVLDGFDQWQVLGDILWNTSNSFTLVAIPLFIL
ncbi:MAG: TRAP transporter large permease, partial [Rhodobacterales bacterium]